MVPGAEVSSPGRTRERESEREREREREERKATHAAAQRPALSESGDFPACPADFPPPDLPQVCNTLLQ